MITLHRFRWFFIILALLLAGCQNLPRSPADLFGQKPPASPQVVQAGGDPATVRAREYAAKGDYAGAAREYLRLSNASPPPAKYGYQMDAAEFYLKANLLKDARALLARMPPQSGADLQARVELAYAEIEIAEKQNARAMARLKRLNPESLPLEQRKSYHFLLAQILEGEGKLLDAARQRAELDALPLSALEQNSNHQALWALLQRLEPAQLRTPASGSLAGWLALALVAKSTPAAQLPTAVAQWSRQFPGHPSQRAIVARLVPGWQADTTQAADAGMTAPTGPGRHIALLLPLSGKFKAPAELVRNGFTAATYSESLNRPTVKVYDADTDTVLAVYQQAVAEGAYLVAGPLNKDAVTLLVQSQSSFPVPTLTLNYHIDLVNMAGYSPPRNLYQFALSAEDEARVAAARAFGDGARRAGILAPQGEWGRRAINAFTQAWQNLGGQIIATETYAENQVAGPIKQLLRDKAMLDMVFVAAYPEQARLIRPQFRYYMAGSIPLYASSQVHEGKMSPMDQDLNDLIFVDMPALLNPPPDIASSVYAPLQGSWQSLSATDKRLYAFGVDAYRLMAYLPGLRPGLRLPGETGGLWVDELGIVHRDLPAARFINGQPSIADALAPPPLARP
jgi:outer membrane PBP1 activator LpoA protein